MAVPKYDPKEIENKQVISMFGRQQVKFATPCSEHDNVIATYNREPYWQMVGTAGSMFIPMCILWFTQKIRARDISRRRVLNACVLRLLMKYSAKTCSPFTKSRPNTVTICEPKAKRCCRKSWNA